MMGISIEQYNKMAERVTELEYELAESVKVVRCKDCENCLHYDDETENGWLWCTINTRPTAQKDFCSFGERKGGDTE